MSFKNQKELWQTLLNGKTIFGGTPNESDYREYRYIDDKLMYKTNLCESFNSVAIENFAKNYSLFKIKKQTKKGVGNRKLEGG